MGTPGTGRSGGLRRLAIAAVVVAIGVMSSAATAERVQRSAVEGRMTTGLALSANVIDGSLEGYGSLVAGASAYFSTTRHDPATVTDEDLRAYLQAVGGIARYPELFRGLSYVARVRDDTLEDFVERRRRSLPSFEVRGESTRVYQAIVAARSAAAGMRHGLRLDTDPERSTALARAHEINQVVMTAPMVLPGTQDMGLHIYGPVTDGQGEPLGWIGIQLWIDDLIPDEAAGRSDWALSVSDNGVPVHGHRPDDGGLVERLSISVLAREWSLTARSTAPAMDVPILVAGLALTLLALLVADRAQRSGSRLRSDVRDAEGERDRYLTLVQTVLSEVDVGIIACDRDGRVTISNDAASRILGEELPVRTLGRALSGEDIDQEEFQLPTGAGERTLLVSAQPLRDGGDGDVAGAVAAISDITERKAAEAAMTRMAMQDDLTGLANRRRLSIALEEALGVQSAGGVGLTLLFMDLDRFKQVNDTIGHHRGDQMLIDVARRLTDQAHDGDVAARVGGDEFVLLCPHQASMAEANRLAHQVLAALTPVLTVGRDRELDTGISIGVVRPPTDATVDDVLRFADLAMYEAKAEDGTSVRLYRPFMDQRASGLQATESALRRATRDGSLRLAFQPIVDVADGGVTAAEALVRWERDGVEQLPGAFLPLAEESSLIVDIDLWVLQEACRTAAQPGMPPRVNINFSARTLALPDLVHRVRSAVRAAGIEPTQLGIELTETSLISASASMDRALAELAALGVMLSLDDFGTGYASLNYLRRFPVRVIKIDREFVSDLIASTADQRIVRGTIDLARGLGMRTVAEGVETAAQAAMLTALGCDMLQGYLLGRPTGSRELRAAVAGAAAATRDRPGVAAQA